MAELTFTLTHIIITYTYSCVKRRNVVIFTPRSCKPDKIVAVSSANKDARDSHVEFYCLFGSVTSPEGVPRLS